MIFLYNLILKMFWKYVIPLIMTAQYLLMKEDKVQGPPSLAV